MSLEVFSKEGIITVNGDLRLGELPRLMSCIHQATKISRYKDILLDFSALKSIGYNVMPPIASYIRSLLRSDNIDFEYVEPRIFATRTRIENAGLAHFLSHRKYPKVQLNSSDPILQQFRSTDDASAANDRILNAVLRTAKISRKNLSALEWAIDEITDNVLNHSQSKVGGFIIHSKLPYHNIVEFVVADSGIGVNRSLGIADEVEAVEQAIQEGVTRNKISNQGNGLYGTYRIALESNALFSLRSNHGNLYVNSDGETHARREHITYPGTHILCQIDCDRPDLIERAFVFRGKQHVPGFDYVERKLETSEEDIRIPARNICKTFGSRKSGLEARNYILNMISALSGNKVLIDFDEVFVISSSFADEAFGKLFVLLGPMLFMNTVELINADPAVEALINRAIMLRMQTGLGEA